jgi:hypothetical protein
MNEVMNESRGYKNLRSENNSRVIVYQVDRFAAESVAWSDVGYRIDDDEVIQDDTCVKMK